jgi:hypothetical protein
MGSSSEKARSSVKKGRVAKLGPSRDAAPEIVSIRTEAVAEHPENPDMAYRSFESRATAAMSVWGPNDQTCGMTGDAAIAWVKAHERQIKVCAAEFRWRLACFSDEDFQSEAIVSAIEAADISARKNEPFEGIFWAGYRFRLEHLCNGSRVGERFLVDVRESGEDHRMGTMDTAPDSLIDRREEEAFHGGPLYGAYLHHASRIMSSEEANAWNFYLSDARPATRSVGERLGLTRQGAEYRIRRGLERVHDFYHNLGVSFDEDREVLSPGRLILGAAIEDVESSESAPPRQAVL